jgi:hypothetical protein
MSIVKNAFTSFPACIATYVCIIGAIYLLAFGWKPDKSMDPVPVLVADPLAEAMAYAQVINGMVSPVTNTGSMRPVLEGGDYVVSVKNWAGVKKGKIIIYTTTKDWGVTGKYIVHRVAQMDKDGAIPSGDTAKHTESWGRVTESNYIGTVIAIYRKAP